MPTNEERKAWARDILQGVLRGEIAEVDARHAFKEAGRYMPREAFAELYAEYATEQERYERMPHVDWVALMKLELQEAWLIDELWPQGRQLHVHAPRKTGKSLVSQYLAARLALGIDPFTGRAREPLIVGYYDWENTLQDLKQRVLDDMEFDGEQLTNLHYYLHPMLPPLDTASGGNEFVAHVKAQGEQVVFLDPMSRCVQDDENSSNTYRNFYRHTGMPLKVAGVSLWRTDNEGHMEGRSRGSSAKADDVDLVWQLKSGEHGLQLVRKASRIADVPESISLYMHDDPLRFTRSARLWPDGTREKARELDTIQAPLDVSRRIAAKLLTEAGVIAGKAIVLQAALNYRKERGLL